MTDSSPALTRRQAQEKTTRRAVFVLSLLPLVLILFVTVALAARAWPILGQYSLWDLLGGIEWRPMRGQFGFLPFIAGTLWVTTVGVLLAVPPCLLTALYLSEYARPSVRAILKPVFDLLAALPSVVYGVWGVLVVVPFVGDVLRPFFHQHLGWIPLFASSQPTGYSILSGGIVLAVMIAPFIIAVTYEVLMTAPQDWRLGSLGLGATRWQTIRYVLFRHSLPGIIAGVVLGTSRAFGETMAVLMVVGNVPTLPTSIFDPAYPLPALIANNYGEMMSVPLYDAALLGAALLLLVIVLIFNIASTLVLQRVMGRRWV
ncbi:MAG: phosphate ABC transporter permease subunit PstC [Anaerolineales bacterium]|nr:phosphate ABC transporter permease subunit PstC [Anaerolineales bacterium]MCX7756051.1 phosphate ABC transporter permease subunit PstC [Anaerolineales bacterium]MDW8278560.1 phosphate ABC transporter permease subunit PstC [Anaerolineales bacterium]